MNISLAQTVVDLKLHSLRTLEVIMPTEVGVVAIVFAIFGAIALTIGGFIGGLLSR
jgi:hypothetical protein